MDIGALFANTTLITMFSTLILFITVATAIAAVKQQRGFGCDDYRKRAVMTDYERRLYYALMTVSNGEFAVLAQVQMTGFIEPKGGKGRYARLNLIHRKSVDFLICDKRTMQPIAAIELQDWTHKREDRKRADRQKAAALKSAGIPLIEFHKFPTYKEIDERLEPFRQKN